jgi:hypothetical protein
MTRMYAIARVAVASIGTSLSYSNTLVGSAASVRRRANSFCDGERRAVASQLPGEVVRA